MHRVFLSAVLTLASFGHACAQQTSTGDTRDMATDQRTDCYNPYIGD